MTCAKCHKEIENGKQIYIINQEYEEDLETNEDMFDAFHSECIIERIPESWSINN